MSLTNNPQLTNMFGPLGPDIQRRLRQVLANPRKYWDRDHGIILRAQDGFGFGLTLWQAILAVDPTFPRSGPRSDREGRKIEDWRRYPDSVLIGRALRYAAHAPARLHR